MCCNDSIGKNICVQNSRENFFKFCFSFLFYWSHKYLETSVNTKIKKHSYKNEIGKKREFTFFVRILQAFKCFLHKQEKRVFVQFLHETVHMQRWVHASIPMHYECLNMEMNPLRHKFTERIFNQQKDKGTS